MSVHQCLPCSVSSMSLRTDGRHVEHAGPKLNEGAALDRNVQVSDVVQDEVDEPLQLRLAVVLQQ
jgi:hypothetical protein